MQHRRLVRGVDQHDHALVVGAALERKLPRGHAKLGVVAPAQGLAGVAGLRKRTDPIGELVPLGLLEGRAQLVVAEVLLALDAPLAAVVHAGNAAHAKQDAVQRTQLALVVQLGGDTRNVVVIGKVEQVLAGVEVPRVAAALAFERVGHLVHVGRVHAAPQALVHLVVGHRVAGVVVHPAVVVAKHGLAQQQELLAALGRKLVGHLAQVAKKAQVKAVGNVKAQTVDAVVALPGAHGVGAVLVAGRVVVVQLHQVGHPSPRLVAKAVVVLVVGAPVDVEPAGIGTGLAALAHVGKRPEAAAHVVEHAVQEHADALGVAGVHHATQVVVGAQAHVNLVVIDGVVAVGLTLEHGVQHKTGHAKPRHVVNPAVVNQLKQAMLQHAIVLVWRTGQAQRIDLVGNGILVPRHGSSLHVFADRTIIRRPPTLRKRGGGSAGSKTATSRSATRHPYSYLALKYSRLASDTAARPPNTWPSITWAGSYTASKAV